MSKKFAVIGVGNMARAIITGVQAAPIAIDEIVLFDKNPAQYSLLSQGEKSYIYASSIEEAVESADCVLLSVKPQNFGEVLAVISKVKDAEKKLYITIAAGITAKDVSDALGGADTVRVLPNLPITIGSGVTAICNCDVCCERMQLVDSIFKTTGSVIYIDESEMNRIIGALSSSPAYIFKFIDCICKGAGAQGLDQPDLISAVCDVFIGSALLLKQSGKTPDELISMVASKGGTTEQALLSLDASDIEGTIRKAMIACTKRADELGKLSSDK